MTVNWSLALAMVFFVGCLLMLVTVRWLPPYGTTSNRIEPRDQAIGLSALFMLAGFVFLYVYALS